MIQATAPGKVVLWGEYAVLTGAPALVLAVNRRAICSIEPGGRTWRFTTRGFAAPEAELSVEDLLADRNPAEPAASVAWHVLRELLPTRDTSRLPTGARVVIDTGSFFLRARKLGIGSSAAACTAVYAACCELLGESANFVQALAIHNHFQNKSGSGIDVAAAFHGGTLRFESKTATQWNLAPELRLRFVWTGHTANTVSHIERFNRWHEQQNPAPLAALASTCQALFEHTDLATLRLYTDQLKSLDAAAKLGIYAGGHRELDRLAMDAEVVYKPCGAGGGDIGVAISHDTAGLDRFVAAAAALNFDSIPLEKASNGIQVTR